MSVSSDRLLVVTAVAVSTFAAAAAFAVAAVIIYMKSRFSFNLVFTFIDSLSPELCFIFKYTNQLYKQSK